MARTLQHKRAWFDHYLGPVKEGDVQGPPLKIRHTCPCCGYPTLRQSRGSFEICLLCFWEDDGQDDADADEVLAGPNGDYSLTEARNNFERYLIMYAPDRNTRADGADTAAQIEIKRSVVDAFDRMLDATPSEVPALWREVFENRRLLRKESRRKIREMERSK